MNVRLPLAAVVLAPVLLSACGADSSPATTTVPAITAACIPTQRVGGGPINDASGPYYHQMVIAQATDGLTLSGLHQVLDHASVPDGVRRQDGSVDVYYVNGVDGAVWVARIEGDTARVIGPITIAGIASPAGVVDPDVTLLPDGRIRLAYYGGFGAPNATTPRAMCIADSDDGIRFTVKATAFPFEGAEQLTDPSLLQLSDGSWIMAISAGRNTIIARSADGLSFTRESLLAYGGVPELARAPDGATRLYVCGQGIESYRSTDGGRTWSRERTVVNGPINGKRIVCDPSFVPGANLFVFKTG
jgi:hypothetical protein